MTRPLIIVRWIILFSISSIFVGCDRSPQSGSLSELKRGFGLEKSNIKKDISIQDDIRALVVKIRNDGTQSIYITRGNHVILTLQAFGNGQNITVLSKDKPCLTIKQEAETFDVIRSVTTQSGKEIFIGYDDQGEVSFRAPMKESHALK